MLIDSKYKFNNIINLLLKTINILLIIILFNILNIILNKAVNILYFIILYESYIVYLKLEVKEILKFLF